MKISLCMILKNEAKTIKAAIESVLPVVDEIIIGIDDKTDDGTYELLDRDFSKSGVKRVVIDNFVFKNDFSAIRNKFIEQCTGDYVLILDGHEYLTPQSLLYLKEFKKRDDKSVDVIDFNLFMDETGSTVLQQPRLFKQHIRYEYATHNTITHIKNRVAMPQIQLIHNQPIERYKARKLQRKDMNLKNLKELAEGGDVRSMFYMGQQHYELANWIDAEWWFLRYLNDSDFDQEMYQARLYLSTCYKNLENEKDRLKVLLDCFELGLPRNEHLIAIGNIFYEQENFKSAAYYYRMATAVKLPERFLILELHYYSWLPWYKLMEAALQMGDVDTSMECIRVGKQIAPLKKEFVIAEHLLKEKTLTYTESKKGSVYVVDSLQSFIKPILDMISEDYHIRMDQAFNPDNAQHANLIWCEWADHNAISVGAYKSNAYKILRIHSYEVYNPDILNRIDFDNFDKIIFVADHVMDFFLISFPKQEKKCLVIRNGIDFDKFNLPIHKEQDQNNKIAWAGYL